MSNNLELAAEFTSLARAIMRTKGIDYMLAYVDRRHGERGRMLSITKAAVAGNSLSEGWMSADGKVLADAYLSTLRPRSVLDLLKVHALNLPGDSSRFILATGMAAHDVDEGKGKAVTRAIPTADSMTYKKVAGIAVLSKELADSDNSAALKIFKNALDDAVLKASNELALSMFASTGIATTGNVKGDLAAGIEAAADSDAYVVVAPYATVAALSLATDRPGFGLAGGEYVPGIHIVPSKEVTKLTVIPTAGFVMQDLGFNVRHSEAAAIEMSDTPTGAGELVSLWQSNLRGIIAERAVRFAAANNKIEVG